MSDSQRKQKSSTRSLLFLSLIVSLTLAACSEKPEQISGDDKGPKIEFVSINNHSTTDEKDSTPEKTKGEDEDKDKGKGTQNGDNTPKDNTPADPPKPAQPGTAECKTTYEFQKTTGTLTYKSLDEASGIVASRNFEDVYWVHNDSGDSARIFAINKDGELIAIVKLNGVEQAFDIEDIAASKCMVEGVAKECLWISDSGNNKRKRQEARIYQIVEPDLTQVLADRAQADDSDVTHAKIDADATTYRISYEDYSVDVEGVVVLPQKDLGLPFDLDVPRIYFLEKVLDGSSYRVFYADLKSTTDKLDLNLVKTLPPPGGLASLTAAITAADLHPTRPSLVLRTYGKLVLYRMDNWSDSADPIATLLEQEPTLINGADNEWQGEAVGFGYFDNALYTIPEKKRAPLNRYVCLPES